MIIGGQHVTSIRKYTRIIKKPAKLGCMGNPRRGAKGTISKPPFDDFPCLGVSRANKDEMEQRRSASAENGGVCCGLAL